ncbi:unnamed protein product [Phaeothamnion confervicola]
MKKQSASAGEEAFAQCLAFFQADKIILFVRAEETLKTAFPETHKAHREELRRMRAVCDDALGLVRQLEHPRLEGWRIIREPSDPEGVRVYHRETLGSPIHGIMCEAVMDAPLEAVLVLLNEIDLFGQWLPFIGGSRQLSRTTPMQRSAWVSVWLPYPVWHRDVCLAARAFDCLDEDNCVVLVLRSCVDEPAAPQPAKGTLRMDVDFGVLQLIPLGPKRTRVRALGHTDPKMAIVPATLINWIATKVCHIGIKTWEAEAVRISNGHGRGDHARRVVSDPVFYGWLRGRLADYFAMQQNKHAQSAAGGHAAAAADGKVDEDASSAAAGAAESDGAAAAGPAVTESDGAAAAGAAVTESDSATSAECLDGPAGDNAATSGANSTMGIDAAAEENPTGGDDAAIAAG